MNALDNACPGKHTRTMKHLDSARRELVAAALCEGNSLRATARLTGVAYTTVLRFLEDMGWACQMYLDEHMRDLPCRRLQCDEIWSFVAAKQKNVTEKMRRAMKGPGESAECAAERNLAGSVWTWTAIDADTKLKPAFHVGTRDAWCAWHFMRDLAPRLRSRIQLTTDGHHAYLEAVHAGFGTDVDYAMLQKLYGPTTDPDGRYSPPKCIGIRLEVKQGDPDPEHISTSYVERSNLTMRMQARRLTRLTNGFSKKCANLEHAVALHHMHYNYVRKHKTLGTTPAVAAGIAARPWTMGELVAMPYR
jgi:IS1 family transposase